LRLSTNNSLYPDNGTRQTVAMKDAEMKGQGVKLTRRHVDWCVTGANIDGRHRTGRHIGPFISAVSNGSLDSRPIYRRPNIKAVIGPVLSSDSSRLSLQVQNKAIVDYTLSALCTPVTSSRR